MRMSSGRRMDEGRECQPLRLAGDWWRRPQVRVEAAPVLRPYPGGKREPAGARCCRTLNRRCKKMHGLRGEGGVEEGRPSCISRGPACHPDSQVYCGEGRGDREGTKGRHGELQRENE